MKREFAMHRKSIILSTALVFLTACIQTPHKRGRDDLRWPIDNMAPFSLSESLNLNRIFAILMTERQVSLGDRLDKLSARQKLMVLIWYTSHECTKLGADGMSQTLNTEELNNTAEELRKSVNYSVHFLNRSVEYEDTDSYAIARTIHLRQVIDSYVNLLDEWIASKEHSEGLVYWATIAIGVDLAFLEAGIRERYFECLEKRLPNVDSSAIKLAMIDIFPIFGSNGRNELKSMTKDSSILVQHRALFKLVANGDAASLSRLVQIAWKAESEGIEIRPTAKRTLAEAIIGVKSNANTQSEQNRWCVENISRLRWSVLENRYEYVH